MGVLTDHHVDYWSTAQATTIGYTLELSTSLLQPELLKTSRSLLTTCAHLSSKSSPSVAAVPQVSEDDTAA